MKKCDNCFHLFHEEELQYYMGKFICDTCRSTCQLCKRQFKLKNMIILVNSNPLVEGIAIYCRKCYHRILRFLHCPQCESENVTLTTSENSMEIKCKDCSFSKRIRM